MKYNALIAVFLLLAACTPLTQSVLAYDENTKILQNIDLAYEPQIRTIELHPAFTDPQATLLPAVTKMGQWNLMLAFDDLRAERDNYYVHIVHCNYDWT